MSESWRITAQERAKHDAQFQQLNPKNGMISGQQARDLFLKSGLPQTTLAKIWGLADVDGDGKMTPDEFSIAIFLITKKLQGKEVPNSLPPNLQPSVKANSKNRGVDGDLAPSPVSAVPNGNSGTNGSTNGSAPQRPKPFKTAAESDWTISPNDRIKYVQLFAKNDAKKSGFLTGAQARPILLQSGLSQTILAQIWGLADYDKNGKLNEDEFCIAMHLINAAKTGKTIPTTLPAELAPGSNKENAADQESRTNNSSGISDAEKQRLEAKKKENEEIQKRQKELAEKLAKEKEEREARERVEREAREKAEREAREKAEREAREKAQREAREKAEREAREKAEREAREKVEREAAEKAEAEKRERQKLEEEKRRQLEIEKQKEKEEQRQKIMAQKEAARKEAERKRQEEWIKQRKAENEIKRDKEKSLIKTLKKQQSEMVTEHQSLVDKAVTLAKDIEGAREQVALKTAAIDKMRESRDEKLKKINELKESIIECRKKIPSTSDLLTIEELKSLNAEDNPVAQSYDNVMTNLNSKKESVDKLKTEYEELDKNVQARTKSVIEMSKTVEILKKQIVTLKEENCRLEEDQVTKYNNIMEIKRKRENPTPPSMESEISNKMQKLNESSWPENDNSVLATHGSTDHTSFGSTGFGDSNTGFDNDSNKQIIKYHAVYKFESRNADELSLEIGDVVLVDESQETDPGWMAGTMNGKSGWFPEAYVEKMEVSGSFVEPVQSQPVSTFIDNTWTKNSELPPSPGPMPTQIDDNIIQVHCLVIAKALYSWDAKTDNQLSLVKDDQIYVTQQHETWWKGELKKDLGTFKWFPKSYVTVTSQSSDVTQNVAKDASETVRRAMALYAFQSAESGDLAFEAGEVIELTGADGDWWSGNIGNRSGIFPANYVSEIDPMLKKASDSKTDQPSTRSGKRSRRSSVSGDSGRRSRRGSISGKTSKDQEICIAIAPYESAGVEQLSLTVGQLIAIRKKMPSGWWEGELRARGKKRKVGWFPGDYVKILSSGASGRSNSTTPTPEPVSIAVAAAAAAAATGANSNTSSPQLEVSSAEHVIALYNYTAINDDELSFSKGNVIQILSKDEVEWWKGNLLEGGVDGMVIATGLFPANYVQALNLPEDAGGIGSMTAPFVSCFASCLDPKRNIVPAIEK